MSKFIQEYEFEKAPEKIEYFDDEPLRLNQNFRFYHNKNKFRKYLTDLQYVFKEYTKIALQAPGIRDTYLKEKYTENYLITIFTTSETIKKAHQKIYFGAKYPSAITLPVLEMD